ncbi:hypothetical protein BH10ACI2_BH10ACI2_24820 [soil metagenome]
MGFGIENEEYTIKTKDKNVIDDYPHLNVTSKVRVIAGINGKLFGFPFIICIVRVHKYPAFEDE